MCILSDRSSNSPLNHALKDVVILSPEDTQEHTDTEADWEIGISECRSEPT